MRRKSKDQPETTEPDLEPEAEELEGPFDIDGYVAPEAEGDDPEEFDEARILLGRDPDQFAADELEPHELEPDEPELEPDELEPNEPEPEGPEAEGIEPASGPGAAPARAEPKKPREPIGPRAKAAWAALKGASAALFVRARSIELPGEPDSGRRRIGVAAAIALACLLIGAGAFLIGKGTGASLDQARQEGQTAGREAGTIEGAAEGYAAGFNKARQKAFKDAYVPAYRFGYKRAFEQAGLSIPADKDFEVPLP